MNPTTPSLPLTRRHFVVNTALAASAATLGLRAAPADAAQSEPRFSYIGFSKPFLKLSAAETADLVAEVGWDGIECPVRARGQIEPARVTDDLPAFVETLRKRNLDVQVVTTD